MKCQDIKLSLPLYSDDILPDREIDAIDEHVDGCRSCRQDLAELLELRNDLRSMKRPQLSASALQLIRNSVAAELSPSAPAFTLIEDRRNWLETWFFPSAVGSFASLLIGLSMLWVTMSSDFQQGVADASEAAKTPSGPAVMLARAETPYISPSEYAGSRLAFASESPSINPQGALIALTRSLVRGEMKDDEVVVVADVFGNGLARISEVIEPSHNSRAVADLQKALESDPAFAPFVPANLDQRSQTVRVVLRIQTVNVETHLK